ncbi:unnamed protein product [Cuscuta europaea]|uniref:RING-CH-type domain-containing protein n=1 Tax=Cuscuta europaea TaxID=41803 RepID=A0A9P0ZY54_CUSEU|nr:unnamed protein product [Cuscuta europaea]
MRDGGFAVSGGAVAAAEGYTSDGISVAGSRQCSDTENHGHVNESADKSLLAIVIAADGSVNKQESVSSPEPVLITHTLGEKGCAETLKKPHLSRNESSHDECRVCQQEKEEDLIELGCHCRGGLSNAHRTCIETWFNTRGSNKCEICHQVAANVAIPESRTATSYLVWRIDPSFRGTNTAQQPDRGCFSPLGVAFSILIGGLLLDLLISLTLGVSALPVNIIIGVIVVLGLGTALRLALEFCHDWNVRRVVHRMEANVAVGFNPPL